MEIRQLIYFMKVCEHGSILQASKYTYISQQALSKAISSLEKEIGLPLFFRNSRGIELTAAGSRLREMAGPVISSMEYLTSEMKNIASVQGAVINIAATSGMEFFVDDYTISKFSDTHQGYDISINEHPYQACEDMVGAGTINCALINGPSDKTSLLVKTLSRRTRMAVVPKSSPLSQKKQLSISDFKDCSIISSINNRCHGRFLSLCHRAGFEPKFNRVGDSSTVYSYCKTRPTIGLVIDFMVLRDRPRLPGHVAIPLNPDEIDFPIDFITNKAQFERSIIKSLYEHMLQAVSATKVTYEPLDLDWD